METVPVRVAGLRAQKCNSGSYSCINVAGLKKYLQKIPIHSCSDGIFVNKLLQSSFYSDNISINIRANERVKHRCSKHGVLIKTLFGS